MNHQDQVATDYAFILHELTAVSPLGEDNRLACIDELIRRLPGFVSPAPTSDPEGAATSYDQCLICGKPVFGYVPQICCSGFECGCMGQPINPCVCSERCDKALYENIGMTFEDRRIKCGIAKWVDTPYPAHEKLAQEIDDLYEAPSRIRPLRRILEREFGASRSVSEMAKEIALRVRGLEVLSNIEFIVRDVLSPKRISIQVAFQIRRNIYTTTMTQPLDINKLANTLAMETIAGIQSAMSKLSTEKDAEIARHKAALKVATERMYHESLASTDSMTRANLITALQRITEELK